MLDSLFFTINAILPLILIVLIGYILKSKKIIDEKFFDYGSKFCFYIALPISLFKSVYTSDFSKINWIFIGYCLIFTIIIFFIMIIIVCAFCKVDKRRGVIIQASFRSNYAYIGIPLAATLFGDNSLASLMAAFSIPLYNMLSVIALTVFMKNDEGKNKGLIECLKGIIKNPLIISILIAIILNLIFNRFSFNDKFIPNMQQNDSSYFAFISKTIVMIASLATPLSLFVIGGQFKFNISNSKLKPLILSVTIRLVIVPVIALLLGILIFKFRGQEVATMIALFATPAAVASAIMAKEMDNDEELANQIVVWSTIFSTITLFIIIFVCANLNLFK